MSANFTTPRGTASDPALSCKAIKAAYPFSTSGTYKLSGPSGAFDVFCDQDTGGGGWTLVVKVDAGSTILNRNDLTRWRLKSYLGDISRLTLENAIGPSYESVPFSDVLIRSLERPEKNLGGATRAPTRACSAS